MPIFEYKCKKCGHTTEILEKSDRSGSHTCEQCGSKALQRLFSSFSAGRSESGTNRGGSCPTGTCPLG